MVKQLVVDETAMRMQVEQICRFVSDNIGGIGTKLSEVANEFEMFRAADDVHPLSIMPSTSVTTEFSYPLTDDVIDFGTDPPTLRKKDGTTTQRIEFRLNYGDVPIMQTVSSDEPEPPTEFFVDAKQSEVYYSIARHSPPEEEFREPSDVKMAIIRAQPEMNESWFRLINDPYPPYPVRSRKFESGENLELLTNHIIFSKMFFYFILGYCSRKQYANEDLSKYDKILIKIAKCRSMNDACLATNPKEDIDGNLKLLTSISKKLQLQFEIKNISVHVLHLFEDYAQLIETVYGLRGYDSCNLYLFIVDCIYFISLQLIDGDLVYGALFDVEQKMLALIDFINGKRSNFKDL